MTTQRINLFSNSDVILRAGGFQKSPKNGVRTLWMAPKTIQGNGKAALFTAGTGFYVF